MTVPVQPSPHVFDGVPDEGTVVEPSRRRFERLVIVAHRLPDSTARATDEGIESCFAALTPHLAGGGWIGASDGGASGAGRFRTTRPPGFDLRAVELEGAEARDHDLGFCRQTLLPLFHGSADDSRFEPRWWQAYRRVNRRFAAAVDTSVDATSLVWVHGPQLTGVGALLRARRAGVEASGSAAPGLAHFLHSPFPPRDIFLGLPWRRELLAALLSYDLLGFESRRDLEHLGDCLDLLGGQSTLDGDTGTARVPCAHSPGGVREVRLMAAPRGVDFPMLSRLAETTTVRRTAEHLRAGAGDRRLLVALERLDPARGLLPLLTGYEALLAAEPGLVRRAALVLAVDPEPGTVAAESLRAEVERRVGDVNGRFSVAGRAPILYVHRRLKSDEQVAFHRAADVMLSTPVKDGSGRAALAAAATRTDGDGVLVISDLSCAAPRLAPDRQHGALSVNPYDVEATAATLRRALALPEEERRRRMKDLRALAARDDLSAWIDGCCRSAGLSPEATPESIRHRRPPHRAASRRVASADPVARPA